MLHCRLSHEPDPRTSEQTDGMSKAQLIGWIVSLAGMVVWLYGYLVTGHPSLFDWSATTPWWIADYLRNVESEIGMALMLAGMIPIYWPVRR